MRREFGIRWLYFFIGLMVLGLGVALTVKGQLLGVGSWDVLHIGLFLQLGLTIGLWSILVGIIIIVISSIGLREFPKIGTLVNMATVGLFIDFFNWLIPNPETILFQLMAFVAGVLLIGAGGGIYISANLGAGPRDSLMLLIVEKLNLSIIKARTIMEVLVVTIGFLLGGPVGVGTIIMAFGLGPIMQAALHYSRLSLEKSLGGKKRVANYQ